jgi:Cu-processing system ATP-binding protein
MPDAAIALEQVGKRYGRIAALDGVDLAIAPGECLALVGHNGAGKTTLFKLVLGLARADTGAIHVLGHDPRGAATVHRRIGFLPENVAFRANMTGRETLRFYARLKGAALAPSLALLDLVGLAEAADRRVGTYSKGMRQRLGLAQALLGDPALLLLDEPTSGLDPALRAQFYDLLRQRRADGATIVLSSHALTELEARTDRIAILNRGRMVACDSLDVLRRHCGLPIRIQLSAPPGQAAALAASIRNGGGVAVDGPMGVNGQTVQLLCDAEQKMPLLRRVAELGAAVTDVELSPPTLEQIYAHYLAEETQS